MCVLQTQQLQIQQLHVQTLVTKSAYLTLMQREGVQGSEVTVFGNNLNRRRTELPLHMGSNNLLLRPNGQNIYSMIHYILWIMLYMFCPLGRNFKHL